MPKMKSAEQDPTFTQLETEIDKERSKGNTLSARFVRLATLMALHCQDEKTTHDGWKATLLAGRIGIPPLYGLYRHGASPFVYPSDTLASPLDQRNFYARIFRPAVIALHMDDVGWHTLRHTFASRLAMSGQTEGTIATLLRHSTTTLVRRYSHLSPSHLHAAVETVAAYGKPTPKTEPISSGTVTETGNHGEESEGTRPK